MRALILIGIIALSLAGFWYWTTTPRYSMQQVKEAIKQHDLIKFEKFVDVDTASNRMVDDFLTEPMQKSVGPNIIGQIIVKGLATFIRPQLAAGVKHEIINFVETGNFKKSDPQESAGDVALSPAGSLSKMDGRFGFRAHAYRGISAESINGNIAQLTLTFHNEKFNEDIPLDVRMRKMDGYWQVTELSNFPEFCGRLAELEEEHNPPDQSSTQPQTQTANQL